MKLITWFFIYDHTAEPLAAFPTVELAQAYSEGTEWEIRPLQIVVLV